MTCTLRRYLIPCWTAALLVLFLASPGIRSVSSGSVNDKVILYYFWGTGCPVCEEAKPFLRDLGRRYPRVDIRSYDIMESREHLALWIETAERLGTKPVGVPAFYIGERAFSGFSPEIAREIENTIRDKLAEREQAAETGDKAVLRIPLFGEVDTQELSLPLFTVLIAALDSFNPCAFFVLLFLLSLLIHVRSRRRMLIIGGTFVLCSGIVYFLFMAAWLNLFLLLGHLRAITTVAGTVALVLGTINAKDFFFFKEGVSLSIPEAGKSKLFARIRGLLKAESPATMLTGALVLAIAANSYEILCTAGFPMIFTRVLTLHSLPPEGYYLYLGLYNLVYIVPLAVIVIVFTATLGRRKMSEWQGRMLKLLSGVMMIFLGGVLLTKPALLNNPLAAAGLLVFALLLTGIVAESVKRGLFKKGRE